MSEKDKADGLAVNLTSIPKGPSSGTNTPPPLAFELVTWDGPNDPENPQNWPRSTKLFRSAAPLAIIFSISIASSIFGAASSITAKEYGVSEEVMSLGVALFVAGFAVGPLVFAPLAEVIGNAPPMTIALVGCAVFQIPLALATNVSTILLSRFLAGMFGAGGLAVGSGILADIFGPITRGVAVGTSATIMNLGSIIGPIVGAYIVDAYGWRWTAWTTLILCSVVGLACTVLLRESSHNRLLMNRAARLRRETGNEYLRAQAEMVSLDPKVLLRKYTTKPVRMFVREPILIVMTIYLTLVYGSLYLSYQLFPRAFQIRGWNKPTATLPFLAVGLGVVSALAVFSTFTMTWYKKRWVAAQKKMTGESMPARIAPEYRLPPMVLGAVLLPPALLWFGWSGGTHWIAQVIACYAIGFALQTIFICGIVYIVDVYLLNTVSATSIHVMVRSLVSATFPLFEGPMYETLHINWSATLLAGLSTLIMASPILFIIYGSRIRSWSRFSVGG
jgi:multidrug resistance protein